MNRSVMDHPRGGAADSGAARSRATRRNETSLPSSGAKGATRVPRSALDAQGRAGDKRIPLISLEPMDGFSHLARLLAVSALLTSCSIYSPDLFLPSNGGDGGMFATGGSSGVGGCATPDCAESDASGTGGKAEDAVDATADIVEDPGDEPEPLPSVTWTLDQPTIGISLSTFGLSDWAHFGLVGPGDVNRKRDVKPLITMFAPTGTKSFSRKTDDPTMFEWDDGTPTLKSMTRTGVVIVGTGADAGAGKGEGFRFVVPAGRDFRKLRVWLGILDGEGVISGVFSDPPGNLQFQDRFGTANAWTYEVFSVKYGNVAPNSTLSISWTIDIPKGPNSSISMSAVLLE